jgi:hypothetical protein
VPNGHLATESDGYLYYPIGGVRWDGIGGGNISVIKGAPVFGSVGFATRGAFLAGEYLAKPDAVGVDGIHREFGWGGGVGHDP